jgi:hypothetical protein
MTLDINEGSVCIALRHKDGDTRLVARDDGRSSVLQAPRLNCTSNDDILKHPFPVSGQQRVIKVSKKQICCCMLSIQ